VRGTYIEFDVDLGTLAVRNYTRTGTPSLRVDKNLPIALADREL
jgi:hypothetical protein